MVAQMTGWLGSPILRVVAQEQIGRPQFNVPNAGQVGGVRREHKGNDYSLQIAVRLPW